MYFNIFLFLLWGKIMLESLHIFVFNKNLLELCYFFKDLNCLRNSLTVKGCMHSHYSIISVSLLIWQKKNFFPSFCQSSFLSTLSMRHSFSVNLGFSIFPINVAGMFFIDNPLHFMENIYHFGGMPTTMSDRSDFTFWFTQPNWLLRDLSSLCLFTALVSAWRFKPLQNATSAPMFDN